MTLECSVLCVSMFFRFLMVNIDKNRIGKLAKRPSIRMLLLYDYNSRKHDDAHLISAIFGGFLRFTNLETKLDLTAAVKCQNLTT